MIFVKKERNSKMKKEITKLTKVQKEKIENKMLTTFTVALGSIMVLLYLMNWFQGSKGFQIAAEVATYIFVVAFIALAVVFKLKANKYKKENVMDKAKKFTNWFIFTVVGAVVSFLVYPSRILGLIKLSVVDDKVINGLRLFGLAPLATRLLIFIILIAIYTLAVMIYWSVYLHKAHKSSLNKGKNK